MDIKQPLEKGDPAQLRFYQNGHALFSVTIAKGAETEASAAIRSIIGAENALAGEAPDLAAIQQAATTEVLNALAMCCPDYFNPDPVNELLGRTAHLFGHDRDCYFD